MITRQRGQTGASVTVQITTGRDNTNKIVEGMGKSTRHFRQSVTANILTICVEKNLHFGGELNASCSCSNGCEASRSKRWRAMNHLSGSDQ